MGADPLQVRLTLYDLLRRFDTAMMVTHASSGPLDCRPMRVAASEIENGGPMWFVTSVQGQVPHEVGGDARTLLTFQGDGRYVAVWGRAVVVADPDVARRVWRDEHRAWVPNGPDDPNLRLVKFVPHAAEFWDAGHEAAARYLFQAARRAADEGAGTGQEAYGRINLSSS
jgi:general stress protein 26